MREPKWKEVGGNKSFADPEREVRSARGVCSFDGPSIPKTPTRNELAGHPLHEPQGQSLGGWEGQRGIENGG